MEKEMKREREKKTHTNTTGEKIKVLLYICEMIWSVKEYLWALSRCHWLLLSAYKPFFLFHFRSLSLSRSFAAALCTFAISFVFDYFTLILVAQRVCYFYPIFQSCAPLMFVSVSLFVLFCMLVKIGMRVQFCFTPILFEKKVRKRFYFEASLCVCAVIIRFVVHSDVVLNTFYLFIWFDSLSPPHSHSPFEFAFIFVYLFALSFSSSLVVCLTFCTCICHRGPKSTYKKWKPQTNEFSKNLRIDWLWKWS